jgi:hypothetical protein
MNFYTLEPTKKRLIRVIRRLSSVYDVLLRGVLPVRGGRSSTPYGRGIRVYLRVCGGWADMYASYSLIYSLFKDALNTPTDPKSSIYQQIPVKE